MKEKKTKALSVPVRGDTELELAGRLTAVQVDRLLPDLKARFAENPPTTLLLAGLTEFDSAGLQLLLVLRQTAPALRFVGLTGELRDRLEHLGVAAELLVDRGATVGAP